MNIKKRISKCMSLLLSFTLAFGNVIPASAYPMESTNSSSAAVIDGEDIRADERNLEDVTVTYKQASSFFVTIPKTIVLDGWKQSTYSVKVSGDIDAEQCVYVAPVDGIADTENIDFYMKDQASENAKNDVVAGITHNKFHWNSTEVAEGYKQDDNLVEAPNLTAGAWKGTFQMEIKLETHVAHKHSYTATITKEPTCTEAGEKTYTCDCGDAYTEVIPAKGHKDTDGDGICDECGENDPNHKHSYTETITKEPTCTEAGERTYTCKCGDSYTEEIPAKGHHYEKGECTDCGEKDPNHTHSYDEGVVTKEPTCTEKGEKTFTCSGCGHTYTVEIPAKGHHYEKGECTDCGEKDPDHTHSYDEGVVTKEPTCTEKGEKTFTCSGCGHTYTEEISEIGHIYISNIIWKSTHNGSYKFVQNGNKWTSNNKGVKSSTATSTWTITLDKDTEYSFKYKVSSEIYDKLTITLDSTTIADAISGAGEEITYTTTLTAGTHTLTASYIKDGSTDRNDDCGYIILKDTVNNMVITKEPTCTENGEKTFTCSRCGYSYTEEIPATGHNYENHICTNCGETDPNHVHTYEPYKVTIEPELVSSTKVSAWPTDSSKYYTWRKGNDVEDYYSYTCQGTHIGGNTGTQLRAVFNIELPEDYEGSYDYQYYVKCSNNLSVQGAAVRLLINNTLIYRDVYPGSTNDFGENNVVKTIPLSAGKNNVTVDCHIYNNAGSANLDQSRYSYGGLYLHKTELFDGSEYHICKDCGNREEHHFVDGICTECGWHEGDHTHHYVNGFCDKCGKDETQYNLIIDDAKFLNDADVTSSTQKIRNGDVIELPEKSDEAFNFEGYSIVRAVKNVELCSSNIVGTNNVIYVQNSGPGRCVNWSQSQLNEFGLKYDGTDKTQSELTDYFWKQTAVSDIITIEKPSVYIFSTSENDKCTNTYDGGYYNSYSLQLEDVTNNKTYKLPTNVDDGNIKIRSTRKRTSETTGTAKYERYYSGKYMIYLEPGEYRLSAEGRSGNGSEKGGQSHYYLGFGSPFTASGKLPAPIINNVKHTGFGGTLYELIPIENGQEFDFSTMYSNENMSNIYLVSNWTAKETE